MSEVEQKKVRIDKYLWAIRLFKTRSLAKAACDGRRVKFHDKTIKPSHTVNIGDHYEIKTSARNWVIEIIEIADRRMAFKDAIKYYKDLTPAEQKEKSQKQTTSFYTGKRLSKTGKPTKSQRRAIENFWEQ